MEERLEYKIFTRVGKKKFDELSSLLINSDRRTMSALLRDILSHEKIVTITRDATLDKVMEELSGIRKELLSIGVNINQVTRKLNQEQISLEPLSQCEEVLAEFRRGQQNVDALFKLIGQLSEKWLPE